MKKYLSIVLLAALMLPWAARAQSAQQVFDFESGTIPSDWVNDATYPWVVTNTSQGSGHAGTYCIKSSNSGVASSTSAISATFDFLDAGSISFLGGIYGEGTSSVWDKCIFEIDGVQQWAYGALATSWNTYTFQVTAGTHTFTWKYSKDGSVNPTGDAFFVDNVTVDLGAIPSCWKVTDLSANVTSTSITLNWVDTNNSGATYTVYQIGANDTTPIDNVNTTSYTIEELTPNTIYKFCVETNCGGDGLSKRSIISARTLLVDPVSELPYVCGFEDGEDSSWAFFNGTATNKWYLGSATQNGGSRSIYISNNNGTANAYNIGTSSTVYAYRAFTVSEAGDYAVNFDWKGVGEIGSTGTIYDYLTAYIAPATADFNGTSVSTSGWTDISGRLAGSTAWQSKSCVLSANGAGTYYLVLRWYNDSGTGDQPPAAVDNINIYKITCPAVRNLVVDTNTAPTETSITLDWTPVGEETSWAIRVNGGEWTSVSTHPYTVDNLQPSTLYTFDVIAICSDSSFATTLSTRTLCGDMVLPWTEGFENMPTGSNQRPICWTTVQSNSSYPNVSTTHHSGAASLYMYASSTAPILVATPAITSTTADQLHVSFWGNVSSYGTLYMGLMSDTSDASTFMAIDSVTAGGGTWREYEFYTDGVTLSGDFHVAFLWRANSTSSYACYLDDIVVTEAEACRRPTAARADSTSYYTADLSWSDPTENGSYLLRYALTNNVDDENAIDVPVSDTAYTLTGLSPYTTYYAWVATTCGGTQTEWRSVGSFTTKRSCYPVTGLTVNEATGTAALLSWRYNTQTALEPTGVIVTVAGPQDTLEYETEELQMLLTGLQPASEYRISVRTVCDPDTATAVSTTVSTASCGEVTGSTTSSSSPFGGYYNYGYSQTIYPASMLAGMDTVSGIAFRTTSTPSSYPTRPVTVFIGYTNATEFNTSSYLPSTALTQVAADTLDVSSTGWKTITFTTPVIVNHSQNIVIAVQNHTGHWSSFNWGAHTQEQQDGIGNTVYWNRDGSPYDITNPGTPSGTSNTNIPDIRFIGECEMNCPAPLVMLDSIDANSAILSWTEEGDSWVPQYRIANTTQWTDGSAVTEPTATIMGLVPSTYYEFRVMTICGTDTVYSSKRAGRTGCGDITLPWFEGFEGMTTGTGNRPACWTTMQSNNDYPYIYASTRHSGAASLYMYGPDTVPNLVATPKILVNTSDPLRVKYWAYASSYGTLLAGIMSDTSDTETFIAYDTVTNGGSTWREREFYAPIDATGNVYVAFQWRSNNSSSYTCYLDDISIAVADPCRRPIAARVDSVSYYSAIISWTDTANTGSYLLRYARTNNAEDANAVDVAVNDTVHTLTGLSPYTTYYAWVATTCNGIVTDWRNVGSFTTTRSCYPVTGLTVSDVSGTAALITWNYNTQVGIEPSGVIVTVIGPNGDTTNYASEGTQLLLSPLQPASSYAVSVRTVCDPDTATAVSTTVSTASCGEVTGTTSNSYVPFYSLYENGYSQMLYPASMLASMDTISGVAFRVSTSRSVTRTVTVYVGYTDMTTLTTSAGGYLPASALTQAGTATLDASSTGWKTINFTTPIAVNHSQNVVIAMEAPSSSWTSGVEWGSHTQAEQGGIGNAVYWYRDDDPITAVAPGGTSGTSTTIPDIRFIGECDMSCVAPMLIVDSTTTSTASLSWTMDGTRWIPQYRRAGETNWISDTATTQTHATITDLSHSTLYEFRVMGICEEGDTTYSSTRTAYTECGEITLPYRYGFEDVATNAFPLCWHRVMGYTSGSSVYPYASTTRYSGARSLYIYNGAATARTIVTTPYIPERLNNLEINFWAYRSSNILEVGVMTDLNDTSTFVVIDTISAANAVNTGIWYEFNYQTPSVLGTLADSGYVAFRMIGSGTYYIDDIEILQYNPCRRPIDFVLDSVSPYTASISWTDSTNAGTYRIYWSDTNDIDNANFTDVNATHVTLSGLQADTRYYLWARTLCGTNSMSELATVGSFQTQISCYPILGLTNTSITSDAASFSWSLDSRGLAVDSVLVTIVDLTDSNAAPFTEAAMGSTYHIFTNLSESHKYKAYFSPMCNPDTAEAVEYEFTTISPVCHEAAGEKTFEGAPIYGWYNYGYSQILYPASELDSNLSDITGLSFRLNAASSLGSCLVRIYMGNTPDTAVREGTLVPASRLTLVADSAVIDVSNAGWTSVALDTVFTYDPDSNLVIAIENLTGSYARIRWSGHTRGAGTWVSYYTDDYPVTLSLALTDSDLDVLDSDTSTAMPDIRFHGYCDAPACVAPLAVVTGQDTTTVTLSWMAGSDETSWIVEYRHIDSTAWMVSGTGITATPYTVSGLNHSTHYMFRVGSLCSNGDTVYSNTLEAITECGIDHIPATYNVNNYIHGNTGEFPCWNYASIGLGGSLGNVHITFNSASSIIILPEIAEALNTAQVRMKVSTSASAGTLFRVGVADGNNYTWIDTLTIGYTSTYSTQGEEYVVHLNNYSGNGNRVILGGMTSSTVYLREVVVEPLETCFPVEGISFSNIGDATATVTLNHAGATEYIVEYREATASTWETTTFNGTTGTLSGLSPVTSYVVRARAVCTAGDTSRMGNVTGMFTTEMCDGGSSAINYTADMTAGTSSYSPIGYSTYNYSYVQTIIDSAYLASIDGDITAIAFHPASTSAGTYFTQMDVYMANVADSDLANAFILPDTNHEFVHVMSGATLNYSDTTWQVHLLDSAFTWDGHSNILVAVNRGHGSWTSGSSFRAHNTPTSSSVRKMRYIYRDASAYDINTVTGGTASTAVGDIRLYSCPSSEPGTTYTVTLSTSNGSMGTVSPMGATTVNAGASFTATATPNEGYLFVAWVTNDQTVSTENPYTFTVNANVSLTAVFEAEPTPDCIVPTGVSVSNETFDGATISWTPGEEGQDTWQVHVYNTTFDTVITSQTTSVTVTGLYSGSTYNVSVRTMCSATAFSVWSEAESLTTPECVAPTGVTLSAEGNSVTVSWQSTGATHYRVSYYIADYTTGGTDVEVENATTVTIDNIPGNESYDFYVYAYCGENTLSQASEKATVTLGIEDVYGEHIGLYPNPASTTVTIEGIEGRATVTMVDLNGRETGKWSVNGGTLTINVNGMAKGTYFVRIANEKSTAVRKLVVR